MQPNETRTEKDIAQSECFDAWNVGTDADGASHFWSQYHETVIVIDDGDAETYDLAGTPCETLADWKRHVESQRGWADCRIGGTIADDIQRVAEAAR